MKGSTITIICVFLILIIISVIYWKSSIGEHPKFLPYINMISIFGIIIALITVYYDEKNITIQNDIHQEQDFYHIENEFMNIEKIFINNFPHGQKLYMEMHGKDINNSFIGEEINNIKDELITHHICIIIFKLIEICIKFIGNDINNWKYTDKSMWIRRWRQNFKSKILTNNWNNNKKLFTKDTQKFIDEQIIKKINKEFNY